MTDGELQRLLRDPRLVPLNRCPRTENYLVGMLPHEVANMGNHVLLIGSMVPAIQELEDGRALLRRLADTTAGRRLLRASSPGQRMQVAQALFEEAVLIQDPDGLSDVELAFDDLLDALAKSEYATSRMMAEAIAALRSRLWLSGPRQEEASPETDS